MNHGIMGEKRQPKEITNPCLQRYEIKFNVTTRLFDNVNAVAIDKSYSEWK
jgi:hypothetical protein